MLQKLKTNTLNGYYQESRKKGNELYVITDDYFRVSYIDNYNFGYKLQGFTQEEKTKSIENKKYKYDTTGIDLTKMLYIAFNPANQVMKAVYQTLYHIWVHLVMYICLMTIYI